MAALEYSAKIPGLHAAALGHVAALASIDASTPNAGRIAAQTIFAATMDAGTWLTLSLIKQSSILESQTTPGNANRPPCVESSTLRVS